MNMFDEIRSNNVNTFEFDLDGKNKKFFSDVYNDIISTSNLLLKYVSHAKAKVGVICKNHYEFEILDFACIYTGLHFVSFHYEDFKNNIISLKENFSIDILFIEDELMNDDLKKSGYIHSIIEIKEVIGKASETVKPLYEFNDEDIFTTIFTSGSTGTPKGIEVKFGTIKTFINNCVKKFDFKSDDKVMLFLPLSQYSSRLYAYAALIIGFNVIISIPQKVIGDLRLYKPTTLQAVPYFYEGIYDTFISNINSKFSTKMGYNFFIFIRKIIKSKSFIAKLQHKLFKQIYAFWGGKIRFMVTGAAPIRKEVLEFYNYIGIPLYESYGLVETSPITLSWENNQKLGSVGKVLDNMSVEFDENDQIIVHSNSFWANSYLNTSDEINSEFFINENTIATGDIGYLDKDGFLYLKGRVKDVIVLTNGTKVHPLIIENKLNSNDIVKQSAIFGNGKPFLTAIIVKKTNDIPDEEYTNLINKINKQLNSSHQIRKIIYTCEPFSVENKMVSPSMKLNRRVIGEFYKNDLNGVYGA